MNPNLAAQPRNESLRDFTNKSSVLANKKLSNDKERILRKTTTYEIIEKDAVPSLGQGKIFTTEPKIRRRRTGNKSVRRTAQKLVDSWYPETEVSYKAMRLRLITQFQRCSRQTVLAYLGRPQTLQVERIEQNVRYLKSGTQTVKEHTFKHKLPAKKGYLELFGLATLHTDPKIGRTWFQLHHQRQTTLEENPPLESLLQRDFETITQNVPKKKFLSVIEHSPREGMGTVLEESNYGNIREGEIEREILSERKKQGDEHNINRKSCDINPDFGFLTPEESRILKATPNEIPDRSRIQWGNG